jgi:hypothetical protein
MAKIRRATAFVCARMAITSASAAPEDFVWEGRLVSRNGGASICKLVHVRTAPAQRVNWRERYENQQQRQTEKSQQRGPRNAGQCQAIRLRLG